LLLILALPKAQKGGGGKRKDGRKVRTFIIGQREGKEGRREGRGGAKEGKKKRMERRMESMEWREGGEACRREG